MINSSLRNFKRGWNVAKKGTIELAVEETDQGFVGVVMIDGKDLLRTKSRYPTQKICQHAVADLILSEPSLMDFTEGQRFIKTIREWKIQNP